MDIVGIKVKSTSFGEGIIIEQNERAISVAFQDGIKRLVYPSSFEAYLTAMDANIQEALLLEITSAQAEKNAAEKLAEEEVTARKQAQKEVARHAHERAVNKHRASVQAAAEKTGKPKG